MQWGAIIKETASLATCRKQSIDSIEIDKVHKFIRASSNRLSLEFERSMDHAVINSCFWPGFARWAAILGRISAAASHNLCCLSPLNSRGSIGSYGDAVHQLLRWTRLHGILANAFPGFASPGFVACATRLRKHAISGDLVPSSSCEPELRLPLRGLGTTMVEKTSERTSMTERSEKRKLKVDVSRTWMANEN